MSSDEYYCKEKQDHLLFLPSCCSNKQASCVEFFPGAIIVGAGPSGLATAACLQQQHNIPSMIFEKSEGIASLWKQKTYDRLHLHLPKQFCELPLFPFKDDLPTYPTRGQFVEYLESYTAHFKLQPKFCQSVDLAAFDARSGLWNVQTSTSCCGIKQEYRARWLVVASGENADPVIPNFKGTNDYRSNGAGALFHSSQYRNGAEYAGKKVLVVGCGNTGMEIALDLVNFGASPSLVVRSPVSLLPFLGNRMAVMHWESERERVDSHRCWMRGSFAKSSFYRRHRCSMIQGFLRVFSWGSIGVECWFEVFASLSSHQGVNNRMFEKKSVCEFFHKMLIGVERLWRSCECWRLIQKTILIRRWLDWYLCVCVADAHSAAGDFGEVHVSGSHAADEDVAGLVDGHVAGELHVLDVGRYRLPWHPPTRRRPHDAQRQVWQDTYLGCRHFRQDQERPSQGKLSSTKPHLLLNPSLIHLNLLTHHHHHHHQLDFLDRFIMFVIDGYINMPSLRSTVAYFCPFSAGGAGYWLPN